MTDLLSPKTRRWFRFRLWTLLAVTALFALVIFVGTGLHIELYFLLLLAAFCAVTGYAAD